MDKYKGTYLSQLSPNSIRELDKYEEYTNNMSRRFNDLGERIAKRLTYFSRVNPNLAKTEIEYWNNFFENENIKAEFQILSNPPKVIFINGNREGITEDILREIRVSMSEYYL